MVLLIKSEELSVEKRLVGNDFFQKKNYKQALQFYQLGLVYAATSQSKAVCYGNISAVYAALHEPKSSVQNIMAARKNHTSRSSEDAFLEKLARREEKCNKMDHATFVNKFDPANHQPNKIVSAFPIGLPLSHPANPKVPGLVNHIKQVGDSLIATEDMHLGDVIAVTKSIGFAFESDTIGGCFSNKSPTTYPEEHYCLNCGITQFSLILPCDKCVFRFCSEACKEEGLKGFHPIECQMMKSLTLFDLNPEQLIALRASFKYFKAGVVIPPKQSSCFEWTNCGETLQDEFLALHGFKSVLESEEQKIALQNVRMLMGKMFPEHKYLFTKNKRFSKILESILFKLKRKQFYSSNRSISHKIMSLMHGEGTVVQNDWLFGMFDHSCKPNVVIHRPPHFNENYYVLLSDVKSGEKLTIAYNKVDYVLHYDMRKFLLQSFSKLECDCLACRGKMMAKPVQFPFYANHLIQWNISLKYVNTKEKLEKWFKAQLQEIRRFGKSEDDIRQLLILLLDYLYPDRKEVVSFSSGISVNQLPIIERLLSKRK